MSILRTAGDSSQMRDALFRADSPDGGDRVPVEEEPCVAVDAAAVKATPFTDNDGAAKIIIKGGTVVNDDGAAVADVLIDDGVIVAVEADMEVSLVTFTKERLFSPLSDYHN